MSDIRFFNVSTHVTNILGYRTYPERLDNLFSRAMRMAREQGYIITGYPHILHEDPPVLEQYWGPPLDDPDGEDVLIDEYTSIHYQVAVPVV